MKDTLCFLLHKKGDTICLPSFGSLEGARCKAVPKKRFSLGKAPLKTGHLTPHETVIGQLIVPPPLPPKACPIFSRKRSSKKLVEGKKRQLRCFPKLRSRLFISTVSLPSAVGHNGNWGKESYFWAEIEFSLIPRSRFKKVRVFSLLRGI